MKIGRHVTEFSVDHPVTVTVAMVVMTLVLATLAALPTFWPDRFPFLAPATIDTDPENMLAADEPVRVFHDRMKEEFTLHDMVVLGVINEEHPQGVFNPESLSRIYELTQYARTLRWPDPENPDRHVGVIEVDLLAPSTVDNIEQGGLGVVKFEWLMPRPPATEEEALAIRERAQNIPFLNGTLVSEDGQALAIYLPLTSKDLSYQISQKLQEKIATFDGSEQYHITGLPVAEDTFGVEMFKQMAISAPVAMLVIFLLMWGFFKKLTLVVSPMIVAMVCAVSTMALLVSTGNTIHIMSSMIPIFIMPIAVLDAVHILSEFFDRYQETKDRRTTILKVMDALFMPMLYTSLTTMAGFASLALTPIPPVQVFGLFVAFGVLMAWLWTVTFIPSYIMFIPAKRLENFGQAVTEENQAEDTWLSRQLAGIGTFTYRRAGLVLAVMVLGVAVAGWGISQININDNPTKWFNPSHPIRVADRVLNDHFGGTYMAYLELEPAEQAVSVADYLPGFQERLTARQQALIDQELPEAETVFGELQAEAKREADTASTPEAFQEALVSYAGKQLDTASDEQYAAWDEAQLFVESEQQRSEIFKQPEVLRYIAELQGHFQSVTDKQGQPLVGKSNSLADIVKTVHRELLLGESEQFRIPDSTNAVAQTLITYQNSHRPQDLWHFVTPDYRRSSTWLQLRSGDNQNMSQLVRSVDAYMENNPAPADLKANWFGLTYINVVWQDKMVSGMLEAFLGSFLVVLLMMTILFRSALWGLLSMIPLTVTIVMIYGLIGLIGKDYDMPVAVLSSLSLGLAVDYAIHFLARSRVLYEKYGSWQAAAGPMFGEPARAITRNAIVVGIGFLPLLFAPLVPYKTVGIFIAAILLTAGMATLLILPALIRVLEPWLFPQSRATGVTCNCGTCVISAALLVTLVAVNVHQFTTIGWTTLTWVSLAAIPALALLCRLISQRQYCHVQEPSSSTPEANPA